MLIVVVVVHDTEEQETYLWVEGVALARHFERTGNDQCSPLSGNMFLGVTCIHRRPAQQQKLSINRIFGKNIQHIYK